MVRSRRRDAGPPSAHLRPKHPTLPRAREQPVGQLGCRSHRPCALTPRGVGLASRYWERLRNARSTGHSASPRSAPLMDDMWRRETGYRHSESVEPPTAAYERHAPTRACLLWVRQPRQRLPPHPDSLGLQPVQYLRSHDDRARGGRQRAEFDYRTGPRTESILRPFVWGIGRCVASSNRETVPSTSVHLSFPTKYRYLRPKCEPPTKTKCMPHFRVSRPRPF